MPCVRSPHSRLELTSLCIHSNGLSQLQLHLPQTMLSVSLTSRVIPILTTLRLLRLAIHAHPRAMSVSLSCCLRRVMLPSHWTREISSSPLLQITLFQLTS